jgi:tetratricopeptide (TPR) repeat protein
MDRKPFVILMFTICLLVISCTSKEEKARNLIKLGIEDNKNLHYYEAYLKFEQAIRLKNDIPEAYYFRGNYFYNDERFKDAMKDYDKALLLDSTYADAYYNRGLIKKMNNDMKGACDDWLKAEKLGKANMYEETRWCK